MSLMKFRFCTFLFLPILFIQITNANESFSTHSFDGSALQVYPFEPSSCGTSDYRYFKLKLQISNESEKDLARYELVDIESKLKAKGFKVLQVDYTRFEILMFSENPQNALEFLKSNFDQLEEIDIECFESAQL